MSQVELVRTATADQVRLDGALQTAIVDQGSTHQLDAMILLHGVGSNFYGSMLMESLAGALVQVGIAALRVNTRGHDTVSTARCGDGVKRVGAAYEIVADACLDIGAWVDYLATRGHRTIGVLGHSLGAVKACYALAHQPHPRVACLIPVSPPRLSCAAFRESADSGRFLQSLGEAESLVAAGRPDDLFLSRFPFPTLMSAACYIDKYGPAERYNVLKFVDRIHCPTLYVFGQTEVEQGGIAFAGMPEAIRPSADTGRDLQIVAGADHFYSGQTSALIETVLNWLTQRFSA
ncbi:MAG: alpha/beta fold hydrolase [Planctomycetota bacterium]|nr:alpha/beta fold hydrolase [Planctomycetota bacterium]